MGVFGCAPPRTRFVAQQGESGSGFSLTGLFWPHRFHAAEMPTILLVLLGCLVASDAAGKAGADHAMKETLQAPRTAAAQSEPPASPVSHMVNYASIDCGAQVTETSPQTKNRMAILTGNRDAYLLSPCKQDMFYGIELCQEILVTQLQLANFELFSSMAKEINIYIRAPAPTTHWVLLEKIVTADTRALQKFLIKDSIMFTKYIKLEIISHYGHEFYCPLSLVRVFGVTMLEDYHSEKQGPLDPMLPDAPLIATSEQSGASMGLLSGWIDTLWRHTLGAARPQTRSGHRVLNATPDSQTEKAEKKYPSPLRPQSSNTHEIIALDDYHVEDSETIVTLAQPEEQEWGAEVGEGEEENPDSAEAGAREEPLVTRMDEEDEPTLAVQYDKKRCSLRQHLRAFFFAQPVCAIGSEIEWMVIPISPATLSAGGSPSITSVTAPEVSIASASTPAVDQFAEGQLKPGMHNTFSGASGSMEAAAIDLQQEDTQLSPSSSPKQCVAPECMGIPLVLSTQTLQKVEQRTSDNMLEGSPKTVQDLSLVHLAAAPRQESASVAEQSFATSHETLEGLVASAAAKAGTDKSEEPPLKSNDAAASSASLTASDAPLAPLPDMAKTNEKGSVFKELSSKIHILIINATAAQERLADLESQMMQMNTTVAADTEHTKAWVAAVEQQFEAQFDQMQAFQHTQQRLSLEMMTLLQAMTRDVAKFSSFMQDYKQLHEETDSVTQWLRRLEFVLGLVCSFAVWMWLHRQDTTQQCNLGQNDTAHFTPTGAVVPSTPMQQQEQDDMVFSPPVRSPSPPAAMSPARCQDSPGKAALGSFRSNVLSSGSWSGCRDLTIAPTLPKRFKSSSDLVNRSLSPAEKIADDKRTHTASMVGTSPPHKGSNGKNLASKKRNSSHRS